MWFHLGVENFIGKKTLAVGVCDIFVSDFNHIWYKSLSDNEIHSISKAFNPLLEATVEKLKDILINLLENVEAKKEVHHDGSSSNVLLKFQSNIMGLKFKFEVLLQQGDGDMLYKELVMPLLVLIKNFEKREKKLIKIIEDKDAEIEDYKQECGAKCSYLTTQRFNLNEFNSQEFSKFSPFLDCISAKVLSIETGPEVKKEEKEEEESIKMGSEGKSPIDKCDKKKLVFKDKSSNLNCGSKPSVFLENLTVKKRKKHDGFQIKF